VLLLAGIPAEDGYAEDGAVDAPDAAEKEVPPEVEEDDPRF
jgi:hypothetical protein